MSTFGAVSRAPLSLLVSDQIRESILAGSLPVGAELPSEKELADEFGVSRSTIREAVRVLQAKGLLSGGDTVSTARPRVSASPDVSGALSSALRLGRIPLADLVELRVLVEGAAVTTARPERLSGAHDALAVMRSPAVDAVTFHRADVHFHLALAGAGGNSAFSTVMTSLRDVIASYLLEALTALADPQPAFARLAAEHAGILAAIEAADPDTAAELVRAHICDFYATTLT